MKRALVAGTLLIGIGTLIVLLDSGSLLQIRRGNYDKEVMGADSLSDEISNEKYALNKNFYKYKISPDSTVSYSITKRFLNKKDEEVVGATSNVSGTGIYNPETGELEGNSQIDLTSFDTQNQKRDSYVAKLFTPSVAQISFTQQNLSEPIQQDEIQNLTVEANLTVNEITKKVVFNTEAKVTQNDFVVTGTGKINLSDFGLKSPSILDVYTAEDTVGLTFDIKGERQDN